MYSPQDCGRWNHPTQVSSLEKGVECGDRGDSSALSGQTLLCSGIVFTSESEVPGSNLETDSALQYLQTSMLSKRMRTARLLTVSRSIHMGGGLLTYGVGAVCLPMGEVCLPMSGRSAYLYGGSACWMAVWEGPPSPVNRMTDPSENITLPHTSFAGG